jgi:galactokinase
VSATHAVFAPARVNLIGEHTDYSGGLVLPVAVDLGVTVTWRADPEAIRLRSLARPEALELDPDGSERGPVTGWARYAAAVARLLAERGRPPVGVDGEVASTVPIGAGLASSAALDVAVALALCRAAGFELPPLELARLAQEAERLAVGVPCGLMDPAVSLLARRGHALLLDCGTEEYRLVPLPPGLAIVVLDSGVRHSLEHSGYAERRAELERGLAGAADEVAVRRVRHVRSENERVRRVVAALEAGDLGAVGALFREGHESLRVDFEVSIPELDLLVDLAYERGAAAARMTGGGFGGSVVALVGEEQAASLAEKVVHAYWERTGREGASYVCAAAGAAGDVESPAG